MVSLSTVTDMLHVIVSLHNMKQDVLSRRPLFDQGRLENVELFALAVDVCVAVLALPMMRFVRALACAMMLPPGGSSTTYDGITQRLRLFLPRSGKLASKCM